MISKWQALAHQVSQRAERPGGNAVGVDGNRDSFFLAPPTGGAGRQLTQVALQIGAQQAQLLGVFEQQQAGRGGLERAAAHDQHGAHLRLQRAQALRDGRLGDVQPLRRALETGLLDDGREALQGVGIKGAHRSVEVMNSAGV
jgi:hypothetical protein